MATRITMRCREHGTEHDFFFDGVPPQTHHDPHGLKCEHPEPDGDRYEACVFDRVWAGQAPAIGAVAGAGGSPARTAT